MKREELVQVVHRNVMTSRAVISYLGISKQSLSSLVKRRKLVPILEEGAVRLFLREDVVQRKTDSDELRERYRPYEDHPK